MKIVEFYDFQGHKWAISQPRIDNAMPLIQKRIKKTMPVETVDAEKMKSMVASIEIDCQRDITPAEANQMVNTIKEYIIHEIDVADKFYLSKGEEHGQSNTGKKNKRV